MKRFYKAATASAVDGGWTVLLDGKPIRTPARSTLLVPGEPLAQALADEWGAQGDAIDLASMPLGGMANAAIDIIAADRAAFAASLAAYGESDLLCYRAPEADLAAHQASHWNPLLEWAEQRYGVEFTLAQGVMHVAQPAATIDALHHAVSALDNFRLAALSPLVTISGSLIIALALFERAFPVGTLWQASQLDELWQEERWGQDSDAVVARAARERDWNAAARFLDLLNG